MGPVNFQLLYGLSLSKFDYKSRSTNLGTISEETRAVRGSDYSPAIELSEQKDNFITENLRD